MKKAYLFIEENEWEGETWNVYFEVGEKDIYKIDYIMKFIKFINTTFGCLYEMSYQLHNTVDNVLPELDYNDYDEDDYYYGGYYPYESINTIDMAVADELYNALIEMNDKYKINIENKPSIKKENIMEVIREIDKRCYKLNLFY